MVRTTSYAYDPMFGKETFVAKMEGTLQYKYDENGSLKTVRGARGNAGVATEYRYDALLKMKEVEDIAGKTEYIYSTSSQHR